MTIDLTREQKVHLLEAVQTGTLDLSLFDTKKNSTSLEDVAAEIIRVEKLETKENLIKRAELMIRFAKDEITANEWIAALIDLWNK